MPFALPELPPQPTPDKPSVVRVFEREDVLWNRPVFKAPPLNVVIPVADISKLVSSIPKPDALARNV